MKRVVVASCACVVVGCSSSPKKADAPMLEPRPDTPAGRVPGWVLDVVGEELPVGAFTPITPPAEGETLTPAVVELHPSGVCVPRGMRTVDGATRSRVTNAYDAQGRPVDMVAVNWQEDTIVNLLRTTRAYEGDRVVREETRIVDLASAQVITRTTSWTYDGASRQEVRTEERTQRVEGGAALDAEPRVVVRREMVDGEGRVVLSLASHADHVVADEWVFDGVGKEVWFESRRLEGSDAPNTANTVAQIEADMAAAPTGTARRRALVASALNAATPPPSIGRDVLTRRFTRYDAQGRHVFSQNAYGIHYPTVETTTTTWKQDGTGLSQVVTAQSHAGAPPPESSQIVLDAAGRQTCRRPSAVAPCSVFMAYDDAGRITKLVTAATEYAPEVDWTYTYSAKGTLMGGVQRRDGEVVGSVAYDASCE